MTSLLLDAIKVVKSIDDNSLNINTRVSKTINKLEKVFHFSYPQAPECFYQRLEEIVKQGIQVKVEFQKTQNLSQQFRVCKLLQESVDDFKSQFQKFLPSNLLKDFEEVEDEIKLNEADIALRLALVELLEVIEIYPSQEIRSRF